MRRERTDRERLYDDAALLYLWSQAQLRSTDGSAGDKLKLTKLAFLAANDFYWNRIKAVNLPFFRYTWGPYAKEINTNWTDLTRCNAMVEDEQFQVTDQGRQLAEDFGNEVLTLDENRHIRVALDGIADTFGGESTERILRHVYDMRCYTIASLGSRRKVESIPQHVDLTAILDDEEAEYSLVVPPGWEMTLELAFHPDALRNLERGIADTHSGRMYGLEALGADV